MIEMWRGGIRAAGLLAGAEESARGAVVEQGRKE